MCNKARFEGEKIDHIYTVVAYWRPASRGGRDGWFAKGWYDLKKNKCVSYTLPGDEYGNPLDYTVMVYGEAAAIGRSWQGSGVTFCVINDVFEMREADLVNCEERGGYRVQGFPVEVGPGGRRLEFRDGGQAGIPRSGGG